VREYSVERDATATKRARDIGETCRAGQTRKFFEGDERESLAMTAQEWPHVQELLNIAIALGPEPRAKFLDEVCAADTTLRAELESMLLSPPAESPPKHAGLGAAPLEAGQLFARRFRLVRKLGEGGMGQVWLAEQTAPVHRPVAVKLIKAGMYDETVVHRFQSERQSLAIMDHPAIAKVFDAGATPQGQPYLVMEYVPGPPITDYCDQKRLKIRDRLELFIQACEGVQHAHQKAIIHRDLKPANILVVGVDGKPVPRIIDFGIAKATTPRVTDQTLYTQFGVFLGTPGYMSPEQVDPAVQDIDTRTDVYSLGVILYVLLTGLQPFETKRRPKLPLDEWLRKLRKEEPPRPSGKISADWETSTASAAARGTEPKQLMRQLRGDLDWITMKALERERERRYGTPSELAADLRRHLNDEPVVARPASARYQLRKFMRRHRVTAVVAGMVLAFAIVASGAGLIAVRKQHEAEYQAAQALQAQMRLLIEAAAQRLKDADVASAQGIILEVLTTPRFVQARTPAAISVFQDIRAADAQLAVLSGHGDIVNSAAYSPDGTRIVTASLDKTARIWDARTGAQLTVLSGHADRVTTAGYSPDGTRIVTASHDKTARIWDARTGAQLATLSGHGDLIRFAAYSPDGAHIATASNDRTARIWDANTGAQLAALSGHGGFVYSAAYSPDGTRIVTASDDKTARIWDASTGAQLTVLSGHENLVSYAAFSPDGTRIVTSSADKTARIWDASTGAQLTVFSGRGVFNHAAYSPDGTRIVTASRDRTARIWDALTGAQLAVLSGHGNYVFSAAYSPDGARIVTTSDDRTARIWDARTGGQLSVLCDQREVLSSAAYSPDGAHIVTASKDGTARIWDARTSAQLAVLSGHTDFVLYAAYSPDGTRIVTASDDRTARIWEARTGLQLAKLVGHGGYVESAAFSPDGTRVVTASDDKTARIWDARTGAQLAVLSGHGGYVESAAFSPDGARIVTASDDKAARIWEARTGVQVAVLSGHGGYVQSAAYSPDGTRIVSGSDDRTARIWDARTGAQLLMLSGHGDIVDSTAYSPDGTRIVTASYDKTARIWDARTGAQLTVLSGHGDVIYSAAYSPDGAHIVTASRDRTARIWDARIPADLAAQILWDAAAETDPLPEIDKIQLGLPLDVLPGSWSAQGSACDQAAGAVYDPDRLAPGALPENITVDIASPACAGEIDKPGHSARSDYQMGRILFAKGNVFDAKRQFEVAVIRGYRAARVDLADLLVNASAKMLDPVRAATLYETAWRDGVSIAAFRLGHLYEYGLQAAGAPASAASKPDPAKAWFWYRRGADAGDPNALARFAEREENTALAEPDPTKMHTQLLRAFMLYSAAAGRAHDENWPDGVWKSWRYRRASLARILAHEGMMQQVADAYGKTLDKWAQRAPTLRERIAAWSSR
jgi:WD40 repeat protein/TPR repeat protein